MTDLQMIPLHDDTITIPRALYDQLKQFAIDTAMELAEEDYADIDSHQLWLDAKDQAQVICDSQDWAYEDHSEDEEDDDDLLTCAGCGKQRAEQHISSCYGCYILGHNDSYCNDGCLEEHLKHAPGCVAIYDHAGAIAWEEQG